jgi:hypothetical protein
MYSSSNAESGSQDQGIARKQHEPVLDSPLWFATQPLDSTSPIVCVAPQRQSG